MSGGKGPEPAGKPGEARFSVGLPPALAALVETESARRGVSRRQLVKLALTSYLQGPAPGNAAKSRKPRRGLASRQAALLTEVRDVFGVSLAMDRAGLEHDEVRGWLADEAFAERFTTAQEAYLERVEADLVAVGRGAQKGVTAALAAFLNAHHPSYGRLRIEQMVRHVGAMIESFYEIIRLHAGEKLGEIIVKAIRTDAERYMERFSD